MLHPTCWEPIARNEKGDFIVTSMKYLLAGAMVAGTIGISVPASAQRITIGPDGPGIDLRTRQQRMRDREMARRDREDGYYREQRFYDRDQGYRRGYDY